MLELWVPFFISAGVIVVAGLKISFYGDIIAEKSGLGRTVVGLLLISAATSLPELVTSIKAATLGNPDLIVGNMVGSNLFNLTLLFLLDCFIRKGSVYTHLNERTVRTASGSMLLIITLAAGFLLAPPLLEKGISTVLVIPRLGLHLGFDSILLVLVYAFIVKKVVIGAPLEDEATTKELYRDRTLKGGVIGFAISAACIVVAGLVLTNAADGISKIKVGGEELGGTFVGSLFLAIVTSLPEMIATLGAVKIQAYDMALGNIFGSNLFNLTILFAGDLFFTGGGLTAKAGKSHLVSILAVLAITTLALMASRKRNAPKRLPVPISWAVLLIFIGTQLFLFFTRG